MKFLKKLEWKYGKYAIPNLIRYILALYVVGTILGVVAPGFYESYLSLDMGMVFKGQVWRLFTFIMAPYSGGAGFVSLLFFAIEIMLYYMIGNALESAWGSFRCNLYLISGILFNIMSALLLYLVCSNLFPDVSSVTYSYQDGLYYVFQSMFLAFAFLYPDVQLLLMMVLPVKVKWLGYLYGAIMAYSIGSCFVLGLMEPSVAGRVYCFAKGLSMLVAMANFLLFFLWSWKLKKPTKAQAQRRKQFRQQARTMASQSGEPRHRCAICGRTEQDNPNLEFRFCSKCDGNYEYCSDHLFTHEHVKK